MDFEVSDLGFEVHQHHQSFTIHSPSISRGQITKSPWPNVFLRQFYFQNRQVSRVEPIQQCHREFSPGDFNTMNNTHCYWESTPSFCLSFEMKPIPTWVMKLPYALNKWWTFRFQFQCPFIDGWIITAFFSAVWFPTFEAQKIRDLDDVISNHSPGGNPIQINQTLFSLLKCFWSNLWNLWFFRRNLFSLLLTVSISMWVFLEMGVPPNHQFQWDSPLQTIHLGVPPWLWKPPCVLKTPSKISIGRPSSSHATRMQQGRAPLGLLSYNHLPSGKSNVAMQNHLYMEALMEYILSGWWLGHPSEKYERQLLWLFPIYGKIKHVPNHQPAKWRSVMAICPKKNFAARHWETLVWWLKMSPDPSLINR